MAGIEFLEPDAIVPDVPTTTSSVSTATRVGPLIPAGLWTLGAVLAALAPFQRFYVLTEHAYNSTQSLAVDGWGTVQQGQMPYRQFAAQYGVVLSAAAGMFAIAAVLAVLRVRRPAAAAVSGRFGTAAGLLGVGGAAGALASALLNVLADRATIDSSLSSSVNDQVVQTSPSQSFERLEFGPMLWLGAAALLLAVTAIALGRLARPAKPADVAPESYADLRDDDDEQFG